MYEPPVDLVRAAAGGDLAAYETIVRAYQDPVWRFLRYLVTDPDLAHDLAQETFLRLHTKLASYRFRSRFSTWLFQVARNLAIDELRRRGRRDALTAALRPRLDRPGPDLHAELEHALADLSPKLREALLLIEVGGFTYREAGELLGVREGTVKSRVFHARRQVTSWFADGDEEVTGEV